MPPNLDPNPHIHGHVVWFFGCCLICGACGRDAQCRMVFDQEGNFVEGDMIALLVIDPVIGGSRSGNSSSGIHEAPTFKVPVVNIGSRQQGRERAGNVIDVPDSKSEIVKAVTKALNDRKFRNSLKRVTNPYGDGKSSERIVKILKTIPLKDIIQKKFYENPNVTIS